MFQMMRLILSLDLYVVYRFYIRGADSLIFCDRITNKIWAGVQ